jgi:hypothetical protein
VLRLSIGVICAGVLVLLVNCNLLPRLTIGDMNFSDHAPTPQIVLIIGFLAGFLERLVPDLLEKATKSTTTAPRHKVVTPPAARASGQNSPLQFSGSPLAKQGCGGMSRAEPANCDLCISLIAVLWRVRIIKDGRAASKPFPL